MFFFILVITTFSMLIDIQSLFLDTRLDTQAVQFPDAEEQDDATGSSP